MTPSLSPVGLKVVLVGDPVDVGVPLSGGLRFKSSSPVGLPVEEGLEVAPSLVGFAEEELVEVVGDDGTVPDASWDGSDVTEPFVGSGTVDGVSSSLTCEGLKVDSIDDGEFVIG